MTEIHHQTVKMGSVVLAIDSNYDEITAAAFSYRQLHVYPKLVEKGFHIERCQGKLARRYYVASAARKQNVKYITGVGHGSEDTFTGDQGIPIFRIGNYDLEESNDKIIHFLSCQTALQLGSDLVQHGCRAFFGYDVNFTVILETPDIFFECDSEIDLGFADTNNAEEVYNRTKQIYENRIKEYQDKWIESLRSDNEREAQQSELIWKWLKFNLNHLCCPSINERWGDSQAKLE